MTSSPTFIPADMTGISFDTRTVSLDAFKSCWISLEQRITENIVVDSSTGCWLWLGSIDGRGYAYMWVGSRNDGRTHLAHRLTWELFRGPIPDGLVVTHHCRARSCVNPDHLEVVTQRDSLLHPDSLALARLNADKTHCPSGHQYDAVRASGGRICSTCQRAAERRFRERKRVTLNLAKSVNV